MQKGKFPAQYCEHHASTVHQFIASHAVLSDWPALQKALINSLVDEPAWKLVLPMLACECAGGEASLAIPANVAWLCLRHAAHLMNDAADQAVTFSQPPELAAGLIFAGYRIVSDMANAEAISRLVGEFSTAALHSALGQSIFTSPHARDASSEDPLELYWQAVILKSGSIFQAGTASGALVVTHQPDWIQALSEYGSALGVMLQILDDCRDHAEDRRKRSHLPGLPALLENLLTEHPEQALPETISLILLEWQRRALHALSAFPNSPALDVLRQIPTHILTQNSDG